MVSDRNEHNFRVQLEFLIDGMDIDEEWCDNYLDGHAQEHVKRKSTRSMRMGSHPKYDGNLTTYIHNETERKEALGVVGRVMKNDGEYVRVPHYAIKVNCNPGTSASTSMAVALPSAETSPEPFILCIPAFLTFFASVLRIFLLRELLAIHDF